MKLGDDIRRYKVVFILLVMWFAANLPSSLDEDDFRELGRDMLEPLGYTLLLAFHVTISKKKRGGL
jgi:hypothetical protein